MIEKLKKIGLTSYESRAYLALLKLGEAGADEIAMNAEVPMGRIYNVLSILEEARIIRSQDTRPRKYASVEPAVALERLLKNKQEELKNKATEMEVLFNDLKYELSGIVSKNPERSFWTVARGEESFELIRESVSIAQKELLYFYASRIPSERVKKDVAGWKYSGVMDALHESLKKGVEIKAIFNKDVDIDSLENLPAVKKLFKHLGGRFDLRLTSIPSTPFDIIDGKIVSLHMLNPLDPEELFAVINIKDEKLAQELREKFFTVWDKAEIYSQ